MSFLESRKYNRTSTLVFTVIAGTVSLGLQSFAAPAQSAGSNDHWVATWSTAVLARSQTPPPANNQNKGTPQPPPVVSLNDQTVRQIVHTSIGGSRVRVVLTKMRSEQDLSSDRRRTCRLAEQVRRLIRARTKALTFSGRRPPTIPPGGIMFSDALDETVPTLGDLAIDLYLPNEAVPAGSPLTHNLSFQTNYVSSTGNFAGAARTCPVEKSTLSWFFLARVGVRSRGLRRGDHMGRFHHRRHAIHPGYKQPMA